MPVTWSQDISSCGCNFLAHAHVNICWKMISFTCSSFSLFSLFSPYLFIVLFFSSLILYRPSFHPLPLPLPFHNVKIVLGLLANNATCECNVLVYDHNIFPEGRVCGRRLSSKGEIFFHVGCLYTAR